MKLTYVIKNTLSLQVEHGRFSITHTACFKGRSREPTNLVVERPP